jgi:threonine dehydrogenase-like Zn-dependent dehydrogenase
MNTDEGREQKTHVVVDTPTEHREVITQRTERTPEHSSLSTGTIALIAIVAIAVIGVVVYVVSNRNTERAADRNANLAAATLNSSQQNQPPTTIIQQPAAQPQQQTPVIIQQAPAAQQQPPVIIQQAAPQQPAGDSSGADASVQAAATQKLNENDGMALISIKVSRGTATLSGSATSAALKSQAERVVRAVRGVTAVDNQITISGI